MTHEIKTIKGEKFYLDLPIETNIFFIFEIKYLKCRLSVDLNSKIYLLNSKYIYSVTEYKPSEKF